MTRERRHKRAYTKAVNMPVNRKAHQTQFPETPLVLTISVTRLGVSVEKVVATIEVPSNHHGRLRPERKNDSELPPARRLTNMPIAREVKMKPPTMAQSTQFSCIAIPTDGVMVLE